MRRLQRLMILLVGVLLMSSCSKVSYSSYSKDRVARKQSTRKAKAPARYAKAATKRNTTSPQRSSSKSRTSSVREAGLRNAIVEQALTYRGTKYIYGGKTPRGFDCSGFTSYVMLDNGVSLRGSSRDQATVGRRLSIDDVAPGDLLFFGSGGKVSHVGIVTATKLGSVTVVHATTSKGVRTDDVLASDYWRKRILYGRDIITGKGDLAVSD